MSDSICERKFGSAESNRGSGSHRHHDALRAQSLVMSIIVVKGSNISSPIDAVSLIGSDNGTQTVNVVSPSITTTSIERSAYRIREGFCWSRLPVRHRIYTATGGVFELPRRRDRPGSDSGCLQRNIHARPTADLAIGDRGSDQQSESNNSVLDGIDRERRNDQQYLVERCQGAGCSSFAQIGTTTSTTFNDTGLTRIHQLQLSGSGPGHGRHTGTLLNCGNHYDARSDPIFAWESNGDVGIQLRK